LRKGGDGESTQRHKQMGPHVRQDYCIRWTGV
jgi:hypothetical protein